MNRSASDPEFLATVTRWFDEQPELLVEFGYARMAGSKDFYFLRSFAEFQSEVSRLPLQAYIAVFRVPQLPLRGVVNADFIEAACALVPNGTEYLVVMEKRYYNSSQFYGDITHQELLEYLGEEMGETAAFGLHPQWSWFEQDENVSVAVVPNADGTVTAGPY